MTCTCKSWLIASVMFLGALAPSSARADGFLGDWLHPWHGNRDCVQPDYSPLHYWATGLYRFRAQVHPSYLDQYPPGPTPGAQPDYDFVRYRCRSQPPMPSAPYADPLSYYGRPVGLPFSLP